MGDYRIIVEGAHRIYEGTNKRRMFTFARAMAECYETTASVYALHDPDVCLIARWKWTPKNGGRVFRAYV